MIIYFIMETFIKYLQNSFRPTNSNELYTDNIFNKERINSLVLDGIYISGETNENLVNVEFVKIGNRVVYKKTNNTGLEWLNENDTFNWSNSDIPMYRRLLPPPYETVNHTLIIKSVLQEYQNNNPGLIINYIEYGVRWGDNFKQIVNEVSGLCYGVDINIQTHLHSLVNNKIKLYEMSTDTFGESILNSIKFNSAFIDAAHSSKSVFKDFEYVFNKIDISGYIFLHDTYPCSEDFLDPNACNDCYKVPSIIKEKYKNYIELLTLPLNPGLTIIRKLRNFFV